MTSPLLLDAPQVPQLPEEGHNILSRLILRMDALTDALTKDRNERRAMRKASIQAVPTWIIGAPLGQTQTTMPAAGVLVLDLGGPQVGREWEVTRLAVSDGGNFRTALSGTADWYAGKSVAGSGIAGVVPLVPTQVVWTFPNLPNIVETEETIKSSDRLYCVIAGATSGQSVMAKAKIRDYDPTDQLIAQVF